MQAHCQGFTWKKDSIISWYGPHMVRMHAFLKTATRASPAAPVAAIVPVHAPVHVPVHVLEFVSMAVFVAHRSNVQIGAARMAARA